MACKKGTRYIGMRDRCTYLSFYLKVNRIHIFTEALREIGSPDCICFMLSPSGKTMILKSYPQKDYHSHRVPLDVYNGKKSLEISSIQLCKMLSNIQKWNRNYSYRVPGTVLTQQKVILFQLDQAECIIQSQ